MDDSRYQRLWPFVAALNPVEQVSNRLQKIRSHTKHVLSAPTMWASCCGPFLACDDLVDLSNGDALIWHLCSSWDGSPNKLKHRIPQGLWSVSACPSGMPSLGQIGQKRWQGRQYESLGILHRQAGGCASYQPISYHLQPRSVSRSHVGSREAYWDQKWLECRNKSLFIRLSLGDNSGGHICGGREVFGDFACL